MTLYSDLQNADDLEARYSPFILGKYLTGSHAYGLSTPASDRDFRGIFVLPSAYYLRLGAPLEQVSDEKNDRTFYALKRYCELAATANPNIIELLFMPDDCKIIESPLLTPLLENRNRFITKAAYESHIKYAQAQMHRARGKNKRVNNPFSETPPQKEDFSWFVPLTTEGNQFPYRPIPLAQSNVNLDTCRCAAMERVENVYRIYQTDDSTGGIFKDGQIVCSSISFELEKRCIGLLIFHQADYQRQLRDFHQYWEWRNNRNNARWESQEAGQRDYDAKNMMHVLRLLISAESIFLSGAPAIRMAGDNQRFLMAVRQGEYSWEEIIHFIDEKTARLNELFTASDLPDSVDSDWINSLIEEITVNWENNTKQ